ncbi:MAG: serine/threonine protein kinase [Bacteroidetes bacterium]|nr:serine/threonine protein kinase [Bacteroidota bacterium]
MIGSTISHFRIVTELGRGAMGIVYQAEHTRLGRMVALKVLQPHLSLEPDAKARFIQEAKSASSLDHSNICTIYEIVETESGQLVIAMGFYSGGTLRHKIVPGGLPLNDGLDYASQVASGLAAAHKAGIVHRDIKPANVM